MAAEINACGEIEEKYPELLSPGSLMRLTPIPTRPADRIRMEGVSNANALAFDAPKGRSVPQKRASFPGTRPAYTEINSI